MTFGGHALRLKGGTTRAARVLARRLEDGPSLEGWRVAELGAGAGLVSLSLALLGAEVFASDQAPMLETLSDNLDRNLTGAMRARVRTLPLFWGDGGDIARLRAAVGAPLDLVVGSDLIFAKEGIDPLLATLQALCPPGGRFRFAYIPRFFWEEAFFVGMQALFDTDEEGADGDVSFITFRRRRRS